VSPFLKRDRVSRPLFQQGFDFFDFFRDAGGQDVAAIFGDEDGIFDADAEVFVREIERWLNGHDHAFLEDERARTGLNIMDTHTDQMPEAAAQTHRVDTFFFEAAGDKVVNVFGGNARFEGFDAGFLHLEDGAVDFLLLGGKFARDRPGAGNVHGEIIQVAAKIHQDELAGLHLAVISLIMHDAGVRAGTDNRSKGRAAAAVAEENLHGSGFELIFVGRRAGGQHGSFNRFG